MNEFSSSLLEKPNILNTNIKGITLDSRRVKPGDLFVALKGLSVDGRTFIPAAKKNGAVAALVEGDDAGQDSNDNKQNSKDNFSLFPIIPYKDLRNALGFIADRFYGEPSRHTNLIGITGTNGKTSCTHFIAQLMKALNKTCAVMGTLGNGILGELVDHQCTTPDAIITQSELARFRDLGATAVAMEVTSHALAQKRVNGSRFHTAIFTNLTRDHLDYHGDMGSYFAVKKLLFLEFKPKYSIINLDDEFGRRLWKECLEDHSNPSCTMIGYGIGDTMEQVIEDSDFSIVTHKKLNFISVTHYELDHTGIKAVVRSPWGIGEFHCSLLGRFNLSNILASIAALCVQGFAFKTVLEAIPTLTTAAGRMVRLGGEDSNPLVVVDYAHSPDSLKQVLSALRPHCQAKLWCVFGCGGDRDRGKRPLMARIVEELSDKIVLTHDNPRTEDPHVIIQETMQGFTNPNQVHLEPDRAIAIQYAVQSANPGDLVLVAGKGHETYQIVGKVRYPFDDHIIVANALARRN